MEERNHVAWWIEQALDAERRGAGHTRDVALAEAQRMISEQASGCYDCRTLTERVAAIEQRQEEDAATFGEHARRLDGIDDELADQTQRLSALESWRQHCYEFDALLKAVAMPVGYKHAAIRLVRCDYCHGSGEYLGATCHWCGGTGEIREMPPEDEE